MNKLRILAAAVIVMLLSGFMWSRIGHAQSFHTGDNVNLTQSKPLHSTVFAAGRSVDINAEVFGDVYCAGQNVTVSGKIHGDVICAGQNVNVSGVVDGDVRLAGQAVRLGAMVAGNASIGGQSFDLESEGKVGQDALVGSNTATFNGPVGRDIIVGGSTVTIASTVGRNIKAGTEQLHLNNSAKVAGDIAYTSNNELQKDNGATVNGKVERTVPKTHKAPKRGAVFGFGVMWFVYWFLAMLVVAMAVALLFPRVLWIVTEHAMPQPWKALLVGFLGAIATPVILVLLAITVIGLPLALILALLWGVITLLSGAFTAFYVGRLLLRDSRHTLLIMLAGAALLIVLYFIPFVGILALVLAVWTGAGMILLELLKRTPKPEYSVSSAVQSRKRK